MAQSRNWLAEFAKNGMHPIGDQTLTGFPLNDGTAVVNLPIPPSVNNLYFNSPHGGRVMTSEGKDWCEKAIKSLEVMKKPINYPITIHYVIREYVRSNRDGANMETIIVDCMKKAGVIEDDDVRRVVGESWRYEPTDDGKGVDVWWEPASAPPAKKTKRKNKSV